MRKLLCSIAMFALLVTAAAADKRGPSTMAERKRALEVIKNLEQRPLDPALKQDREWVFQWLKEVPDVNANMCTGIIGPLLQEKPTDIRSVLTLQDVLASAAFQIENPAQSKDRVAVYMAATEGMLRTYDNILKSDPSKTSPFLEDLKQKRSSGELLAYVKQGADVCSKHTGTLLMP